MRTRDSRGRFVKKSVTLPAGVQMKGGRLRDARGRFVKASAVWGSTSLSQEEPDSWKEGRALAINQFVAAMEKAMNDVHEKLIRPFVIKVGLELLRRLVFRTPVDTGNARGGWQVAFGSGSDSQVPKRGADVALSAGQQVLLSFKNADRIVFYNNVPYIEYLDVGRKVGGVRTGPHSKQAPNGIVYPVMREMKRMFS